MIEYIEKTLETDSGCAASCWRVVKVELHNGKVITVVVTLHGWKDIDAFMAGKTCMDTRTIAVDGGELMPSYAAVVQDLLTTILSSTAFIGGEYKTAEEPITPVVPTPEIEPTPEEAQT